jgi:hypothetical protein
MCFRKNRSHEIKIGEAMNKAAPGSGPGSSPESEGGAVKDAEFKDKGPEGETPKA